MSSHNRVQDCKKNWLTVTMLMQAASAAKTVNQRSKFRVPKDYVGAYNEDDGCVIAVPESDNEYYYSDVWFSNDEVR